jgi:hypothetical protein
MSGCYSRGRGLIYFRARTSWGPQQVCIQISGKLDENFNTKEIDRRPDHMTYRRNSSFINALQKMQKVVLNFVGQMAGVTLVNTAGNTAGCKAFWVRLKG